SSPDPRPPTDASGTASGKLCRSWVPLGNMASAPLTVGFDLDMTLIDSRPGIAAAFRRLADRTGVSIDVDAVVGRLGPPLSHEMANWFPPERVDEAVALYRSFYPADAIAPTRALPGAVDALAAVH